MAHFAELDENNKVIKVIVVHNNELLINGVESEEKGIQFCQNLFGGNWKQTSYNNTIRKNFASKNFTYDPVNDVFIAPQPYPSWILDENFDWQPPKPRPNNDIWAWSWDEENQEWLSLKN